MTGSTKGRRVEVTAPTLDAKRLWADFASRRGQSLSELAVDALERMVAADQAGPEQALLHGELDTLRAELAIRERKLDETRTLLLQCEAEREALRANALQGPDATSIDGALIQTLQDARSPRGRPRAVSATELRLRFPASTRTGSLAAQLALLELHGLVRSTAQGWIWND